MLMVILGAGASYDSAEAFRIPEPIAGHTIPGPVRNAVDPGAPWRPPLAKSLFLNTDGAFGDLVSKYPKLSHVLPLLRDSSTNISVEEKLEALQVRSADNSETKRELASVKFYLADLLMTITDKWTDRIDGVTNYAPLIGEILRLDKSGEEVCLVTFNYDLLLERALVSFRDFEMKGPEEFLSSHPRLKIFKLHGSVNWSRTVGTAGALYSLSQIIDQADFLQPSDRFVAANAAREYGGGQRYGSVFPAIAIPVRTKTESSFECPASHLKYLGEMLPKIKKVLIIGWQAREAHFTGMLKEKLGKLTHVMVVGCNDQDSAGCRKIFWNRLAKGMFRTVSTEMGGLRILSSGRRVNASFASSPTRYVRRFSPGCDQ